MTRNTPVHSVLKCITERNRILPAETKTSVELRASLGQPKCPCPECGCRLFWLTHSGELICRQCYPNQESVAIETAVVESADGSCVLVELREALRAEVAAVEAMAKKAAGWAALIWQMEHQIEVEQWWRALPTWEEAFGAPNDCVRKTGPTTDIKGRKVAG